MQRSFFIVLAIIFLGAPVFSQFETGSVLGTVRDASGGVVQGAENHVDKPGDRDQRDNGYGFERELRVPGG